MNRHDDDRLPGPLAQLSGLEMEREPARDLWAGIEARIRAPQVSSAQAVTATAAPRPRRVAARRWLPLAAAASFVAGIAALMVLQTGGLPSMPSTPGVVASLAPSTAEPVRAETRGEPGRTWMDAQSHQVAALNLRSENRALVKANLKLVTSAESELRQALRQDPQSPYLQRLLLTTQDQQQHLHKLLDKPQSKDQGRS